MKENPKAKKPSGATKKTGFYVALYSSVGVMLTLAVVIGYNNFATPTQAPTPTPTPKIQSVVPNNDSDPDLATVGSDTVKKGQPYLSPNDRTDDIGTAISGNNPGAGSLPDVNPSIGSSVPLPNETENVPTNSSLDPNVIQITIDPNEDDEEITIVDDENSASPPSSNEQSSAPIAPEFTAFDDNSKMSWPVLGDVVMDYSVDHVIYDKTLNQYRVNDTLCISAAAGTEVRAAADGVVSDITTTKKDGKKVVLDHGNGWFTTYTQLQNTVLVDVGDVVNKGQVIGGVGNPSIYGVLLGQHLGFSVTKDEKSINPKDILAME